MLNNVARRVAGRVGGGFGGGFGSTVTGRTRSDDGGSDFALVQRPTRLEDMARIEQCLPEILGRAMARSWIDFEFSREFLAAPKHLLARYNVFLPENVMLEAEQSGTERPRVVVYEMGAGGQKHRLMFMQLVMLAGR